jgi:hypothetical protein
MHGATIKINNTEEDRTENKVTYKSTKFVFGLLEAEYYVTQLTYGRV